MFLPITMSKAGIPLLRSLSLKSEPSFSAMSLTLALLVYKCIYFGMVDNSSALFLLEVLSFFFFGG